MTKTGRVTKRTLIASVLALSVSATMLIGTSYAWFTDSVASTGNIIKTGNLNIDLGIKTKTDNDYVSVKENPGKKAFDYVLWEPGYTEWVNAKVSTTGNLALKYTMTIVPNGEVSDLADVIDVYYVPAEVNKTGNRATDLANLNKLGTLRQAISGEIVINDTLIPAEDNKEDFATLALHMQETAGNEYQNMSIGTDFSLKILAMQLNYESDSFDADYDKDADATPDNTNFLTSISVPVAESGDTIVGDLDIDGVRFVVPQGAVDEGVTSLSPVNDLISDSDGVKTVTISDGITAAYFDIGMTDQNGNPVEIKNGKIIPAQKVIGKNLYLTEVNHRNTTLTTVANENGEYYEYDAETGVLTMYLASFCPCSVGYATKWTVFPTLNNKVCIGDDELFEAMYVASEAAVTDLASKVDLDALYEADFGFGPLDAHVAICQFMIGGCNGMRPTSVSSWAWQLSYVKEGVTADDVLAMQQQYFDEYKALVDSVKFYPQTGGVWAWSPWPFGMKPEVDIW